MELFIGYKLQDVEEIIGKSNRVIHRYKYIYKLSTIAQLTEYI